MRRIVMGMSILVLIIVIVTFLPLESPLHIDLNKAFAPMSWQHIFGTDNLGRDVFSLVLYGMERSIIVLFSAFATAICIGIPLGVLGAYWGGFIKAIIQLFADISMVVPSFIAALILTMIINTSPVTIGIAIGVCDIGIYATQALALTAKTMKEEYIKSEKLLGASNTSIIFRHIMPSILPPIFSVIAGNGGNIVLAYAGLTFIGLGSDVTSPDLGTMLYQYRSYFLVHPSLFFWPTAGIFLIACICYYSFGNFYIGRRRRDRQYE